MWNTCWSSKYVGCLYIPPHCHSAQVTLKNKAGERRKEQAGKKAESKSGRVCCMICVFFFLWLKGRFCFCLTEQPRYMEWVWQLHSLFWLFTQRPLQICFDFLCVEGEDLWTKSMTAGTQSYSSALEHGHRQEHSLVLLVHVLVQPAFPCTNLSNRLHLSIHSKHVSSYPPVFLLSGSHTIICIVNETLAISCTFSSSIDLYYLLKVSASVWL